MRSGSSSSSSRFKIRPKQVNASTCDFDRCCLQSGDNTGTHLHVSRKAKCRSKQQLHVSTSMESPMSFVSRLWMFLLHPGDDHQHGEIIDARPSFLTHREEGGCCSWIAAQPKPLENVR